MGDEVTYSYGRSEKPVPGDRSCERWSRTTASALIPILNRVAETGRGPLVLCRWVHREGVGLCTAGNRRLLHRRLLALRLALLIRLGRRAESGEPSTESLGQRLERTILLGSKTHPNMD